MSKTITTQKHRQKPGKWWSKVLTESMVAGGSMLIPTTQHYLFPESSLGKSWTLKNLATGQGWPLTLRNAPYKFQGGRTINRIIVSGSGWGKAVADLGLQLGDEVRFEFLGRKSISISVPSAPPSNAKATSGGGGSSSSSLQGGSSGGDDGAGDSAVAAAAGKGSGSGAKRAAPADSEHQVSSDDKAKRARLSSAGVAPGRASLSTYGTVIDGAAAGAKQQGHGYKPGSLAGRAIIKPLNGVWQRGSILAYHAAGSGGDGGGCVAMYEVSFEGRDSEMLEESAVDSLLLVPERLIGAKVKKLFNVAGRLRTFAGCVTAHHKRYRKYQVRYEDGDSEWMVERMLLPLLKQVPSFAGAVGLVKAKGKSPASSSAVAAAAAAAPMAAGSGGPAAKAVGPAPAATAAAAPAPVAAKPARRTAPLNGASAAAVAAAHPARAASTRRLSPLAAPVAATAAGPSRQHDKQQQEKHGNRQHDKQQLERQEKRQHDKQQLQERQEKRQHDKQQQQQQEKQPSSSGRPNSERGGSREAELEEAVRQLREQVGGLGSAVRDLQLAQGCPTYGDTSSAKMQLHTESAYRRRIAELEAQLASRDEEVRLLQAAARAGEERCSSLQDLLAVRDAACSRLSSQLSSMLPLVAVLTAMAGNSSGGRTGSGSGGRAGGGDQRVADSGGGEQQPKRTERRPGEAAADEGGSPLFNAEGRYEAKPKGPGADSAAAAVADDAADATATAAAAAAAPQ